MDANNPFANAAPTDIEWDDAANILSVDNTIITPGSAPTDAFNIRYRVDGGAWTTAGKDFVANTITVGPFVSPQVIDLQCAWWDDGSDTQQSPWSTSKTIAE